ncbi:MAG TPA: thiol-disulfide oxidoreductase DCC family protein [Chitinophagaceae bacterium]|nr:thiol-disulfide oxidoreductase DCC family protein [Chitinophagaceae bacterium]
MEIPSQHPVILFDGDCNLCSGSVQFMIRRDAQRKFRFASLQSRFGQAFLQQFGLPTHDFNSFLLYQDGQIYTRSAGAIKAFSQLPRWGWVRILRLVPAFLRDAVYRLIARNRFRWFGRRPECLVPTPELRSRFLD